MSSCGLKDLFTFVSGFYHKMLIRFVSFDACASDFMHTQIFKNHILIAAW